MMFSFDYMVIFDIWVSILDICFCMLVFNDIVANLVSSIMFGLINISEVIQAKLEI